LRITASCCASLLAEVGRTRPHRVEQLGHDRGDPRKWPGRDAPLEAFAERTRVDRDPARRPGTSRSTDGANTRSTLAFGDREVGLLVARIGLEVARVAELERVHEDRDDGDVAFVPGTSHQRAVPRVERPHRRDEPHRVPSARVRSHAARVARSS
jgi:hypothetical protein